MVLDVLDKGLIDVAVVYGGVDSMKYERILCSVADRWGVLLRPDHPLAARESISPEDLWEEPLIFSRQVLNPAGIEKEQSCRRGAALAQKTNTTYSQARMNKR